MKDIDVDWPIAERLGKVRAWKKNPRINNAMINIEYMKASVRAKVKRPLRIIKCQFGFTKYRYRGLAKNDRKLSMLFALANIVQVGQMLKI